MNQQSTIIIDPLSVVSLILYAYVNGKSLGSATGFVVNHIAKNYLITNWHVVTGRNTETGECISTTGGIPDTIVVAYHVKNKLGSWALVQHALYDDGKHNWIQHPKHTEQHRIDVIALPLDDLPEEICLYPLDLSLADTDMRASPATSVSIIGFPLGFASEGAFPIWKTGHIASDPDINYKGMPVFLIDATTRGGMSGSPVVIRTNIYSPKSPDLSGLTF